MNTGNKDFIINLRKDAGVIICLTLAILACYSQVYAHDFVWDTVHILQQEQLSRFSWDNFAWIFSHTIIANWHPVSWLSHMLDLALFGQIPAGHHLVSVLLNIINSALVYMTIKQLALRSGDLEPDRPLLIAAISALIFAIHPLRVEPVAWVAQRKDLLYTMFTLLSVMAYISYTGLERGKRKIQLYISAIVLFLLALMSKSMAVTLPAILLVLDWHPLKRINPGQPGTGRVFCSLLMEKAPFFVLSISIAVITLVTQSEAMPDSMYDQIQQLQNSLHNTTTYLVNFLLPYNLSPFYPFPTLTRVSELTYWLPSLVACVSVTAMGFVLACKKHPLLLACWLLYLIMLAPASGIIHVGSAASADRYTYLPLLPVTVLLVVCMLQLATRNAALKSAILALTFFAVFSLGSLTYIQITFWKSPLTMWTRVIQLYPDAALAHRNLSTAYINLGDYESALSHLMYISSLGWNVDKELAGTMALTGRKVEAIALFERMVSLETTSPEDRLIFIEEIATLKSE
jgi:hypothetical protein